VKVTKGNRRSLDFVRDESVGVSGARGESAPNNQLAERQIIHLMNIDRSDYDPGQLPCNHERGLWTLEAARRQIAVLSPQTLAQQQSGRRPTASAFNKSQALLMGVKLLVPWNGHVQHDLNRFSAI
jgi:hypothetical protein